MYNPRREARVTLDRSWLLGVARGEREAMGRTIQYTPPDRWELESACAGWRNRDIIAHLAAGEVAAAAVMAGETPSEVEEVAKTLEGGPLTLDVFNEHAVRRRFEEPFRSVVREWGSAADLFLARSGKVTAGEWGSRKVQWLAGEIGASYLVQSRVTEWWLHGEDISAGAGLPTRLEHAPIYCVNDLGVRMIPYALGLAGLSFPGRTVQVDLDAAGGGSWHWSLDPRKTPPPGKRPDAYIEGRGLAFAMVAGRRVPAEYYLAEGTLLIGGDDSLAEAILEHVRAFPA